MAEVRIAAVGDVHIGLNGQGALRPMLERVHEQADVLLLAGDLTNHGETAEARVLAAELAGLPLPIVAVLGNHDYHRGHEREIRAELEAAGVRVLEEESVVIEARGIRIGIAGVKGFGGGFKGACGSEFGEEEMKAFIRHTKQKAHALCEQLTRLESDVKIALMHYSPARNTLEGEKLEIYPFLGSHLLGDAVEAAGCHLALHGHAHKGVELGATPGGVPVRNVAQAVLRRPYALYVWTLGQPLAGAGITTDPPAL
jgi:Icc-related predicted phosphoesterase